MNATLDKRTGRLRFACVATVALACGLGRLTVRGAENPFLHTGAADGTVRFELQERIDHPHFQWPRTLLNYRVALTGSSASPERWTLVDALTGQPVPVQVSGVRSEGGRTIAATVSFFSDLPTGAHRAFVLHTIGVDAPASSTLRELVTRDGRGLVLDSGALKVRLPDAQSVTGGKAAPGPIMAMNDGTGWAGESSVESPTKPVRKIVTSVLDRGPLFARVRINYEFEGGGHYTATVKAPFGYNFVEFGESFSGLQPADRAAFRFAWTGLALTHRRGEESIDKPHLIYYRGEDPHFTGPERVENPAEQFYYRLGHSAADSTTFVTAADFSNRTTGRAVGLCVLDGSKWDDGEYSVWAASDTLSVKFRYREGRLEWMLPLAGKSRHLGIAAYNLNDPQVCKTVAALEGGENREMAIANKGVADRRDPIWLINSRYGGMGLDAIKDWKLDYADAARRSQPAPLDGEGREPKELLSLDAYLKALWGDNELLRAEGSWLSPVTLRVMSRWVVPGFLRFRDQMTPEMRARVTALLLFHSYLAAREEISPIRHMLKGHPNFMADWKYPLIAGAYFFPDHPMAREWADQFEKWVELAGIYYVRPAVGAWEAKGGRWTESIATYNWAFIAPTVAANELGRLFDGRDRLACAGQALHGKYLSGIVTAPVKLGKDGAPFEFASGTALLPNNGFQRIHPPQGAHGGRRAVPGCVEGFGNALRNFDPVASEHLLWINRRPAGSATGFEENVATATERSLAHGTNPRLKSAKYTGYGIVLRAAVDTPDEISVFLQQVDKGPNYRWGFGNENGGGDIYYYAAGNSYSGHFGEDAGDRRMSDTEVTCNTGVYKDSTFRGIGMNDLTEPFYDLGSAQFAEVLARPGSDAYSWPDYESRSVMLVGHDYIIVYDAVNNMSRVCWNTIKGQDKMPTVIGIRGENAYRTTQTSAGGHGEATESIRLEPYKAGGDRMTLVSHRADVKVVSGKKNGEPLATAVILPAGTDYVYQQRAPFTSAGGGRVFSGRVGVIRQFKTGRTEMALFKGQQIGSGGLELAVDNPSLGVCASFEKSGEVAGRYFSRAGGKLKLLIARGIPAGARMYVNGANAGAAMDGSSVSVQLPPGEGTWQMTGGPATPMPPEISRSVVRADGAKIYFDTVGSVGNYRIELSRDGGVTWTEAGRCTRPEFTLGGIKPPEKVHLRVIALNGTVESLPGRDYPVYVTGKPAGPPEGLRLKLAGNTVSASWGAVLGASEYALYRRQAGACIWVQVYRGSACEWRDNAPGVVSAESDPGLEADALRFPKAPITFYEYAVTAVDGTGESAKSSVATTDPSNWRNWYPETTLRYERRSAYWLPPYVAPDQVPPAVYPD